MKNIFLFVLLAVSVIFAVGCEEKAEPIDFSTCPCIEGYSLDEFGNCSPDCTNTEEVCNGVDDDCDRKIDEDDVCVIDPFTVTKGNHSPAAHTILILDDDGLWERISYNQMNVTLKPTTEQERREFHEYLGTLNTKVVGQRNVTDEIFLWQVQVDEPERLFEIKDKINDHPMVKRVWFGTSAGPAGLGNRTDCVQGGTSETALNNSVVQKIEPIAPKQDSCKKGFSTDEFVNCSPDCTNTEEVCNGVDDDCDGKLDEDDVCVINPLTETNKFITRPALNIVKVKENGLTVKIAHNQLAVHLVYDLTKEQQSKLIADFNDLGVKVIGQTIGSVTRMWQVAVDDPERLFEIKDILSQHEFVKYAELNRMFELN